MPLNYARGLMNHPIGIFDSGLGGMSLFLEMKRRLPEVPLLYVADTARFPYGNKSSSTLFQYAEELSRFLIEKGAKTILFGCNAASSAALPHLADKLSFPIIGVIEPAVRYLMGTSCLKKVGIIGTQATIRLGKHKEILASQRQDITLLSQACPLLAQVVEEGLTKEEEIHSLLTAYLSPLLQENIDALILACTHYSFLKPYLVPLLPKELTLIDPAVHCVEELVQNNPTLKTTSKASTDLFFTTGDPSSFALALKKVVGYTPARVETVPRSYWT